MQHSYNMYANLGERRLPTLITQGEIDLPCINLDADSHMLQFTPEPLWVYLQNEGNLSYDGLYLSLRSTERPTYDGKRWFVHAAYNPDTGDIQQETTREVSWVNINGIQLWNASFQGYAGLHRSRGIVDYSLYISRCFGYCFLLGISYDEDSDDGDDNSRIEFTNFYPSIHHYHKAVAIDERALYLDFDDGIDWYPKAYGQDSPVEAEIIEEAAAGISGASRRLQATIQSWTNATDEAANTDGDLGALLSLSEDIMEDTPDEEAV